MHSMQRRTKNAGCCAPAGVKSCHQCGDRPGGAQHRKKGGVEGGQMPLDLRVEPAAPGSGEREDCSPASVKVRGGR